MDDPLVAQLSLFITSEIIKRPGYPLKPDDALISNGLIDSFHLVDLALYIEDQFGVHIDDTELSAQTFDTLNQLASLIRQRQV